MSTIEVLNVGEIQQDATNRYVFEAHRDPKGPFLRVIHWVSTDGVQQIFDVWEMDRTRSLRYILGDQFPPHTTHRRAFLDICRELERTVEP